MKKRIGFLIAFLLLIVASTAIADQASTFADGATAVVVNPEQATPVHQILNAVLGALAAGITALLAWVSKNLKTWIAQRASEANTKESAAWYGTVFMLAGIAVRYAESKFGPDTGKGKEKQEAAIEWLSNRVRAIDKTFFEKTPDAHKFLESVVHAAYAEAFNIVSPLVKTNVSTS